MPVLTHDGVDLHAVRLGAAGPPVLLLHGLLLGHVGTWFFGAGPVLAQDRRVAMMDLRGHGRSSTPATGYDRASHAADVRHVLDALFPDEPVALVGHSFGGLVALELALTAPSRLTHLVLVDTPLPPTAPAEIAGFLDRPADEMIDALPNTLKDAVARGRRQARKLVARLTRLTTQTSLLTDLAAEQPPDPEALGTLDLPVGLIYGDQSTCRQSGDTLAERLPRSRLAVIPGGHYLHLDAPDALASTLQEMLAWPG